MATKDSGSTNSVVSTKEKETKEDFLERIKGLLSEKGLEVSDLQVNLKEEDVDYITGFIGKDWYTFGRDMGVDNNTMEHIKKTGTNKQERKKKLLEYLIKLSNARFEDIIYGLYNSKNKQDPSINDILDYLLKQRDFSDNSPQKSSSGPRPKPRIPSTSKESIPWQAKYEIRKENQPPLSKLKRLQELRPETYRDHFYNTLWYEEQEHMKKLKDKCDGDYDLFIYTGHNQVPFSLNPDRQSHYGFIKGEKFTDDKIEYATQASDLVIIAGKDGSNICTAFKHQYNFSCLENRMYVRFQRGNFPLSEIKKKCRKISESRYEIHAKFEVKHSYFDHLQDAVFKVPDYIQVCLLPEEASFMPLFPTFNPVYLDFLPRKLEFMKLDQKMQSLALSMICSASFQLSPLNPPPPVLLYGPFGSGKTRIIARAAYEVMVNGIDTGKCTRILICAHHPQSIDIFIHAYFGHIEKETGMLPFQVFEISRYDKDGRGTFDHFYTTASRLNQQKEKICKMKHLVIIATYTMSLNLYNIFKEGFFTHLFLDEAAQVREPEAVTPLAMATRNAKIVLAGDDKQVGPNILVLGEEARKYDLHISLLERMMEKYDKLGSVAQNYVTKLSVNYRSHESLECLPKLFYADLKLNYDKYPWQHKGPTGYSFVCSDSKLVPSYISRDHPLVEACIVLEEVLLYLRKIKEVNKKFHPHNICVISSTRKQLNQIREMADAYEVYKEVRKVRFQPSFTIQGHEFDAIFLGLFEPIENDEMGAFFIKSLFNPYVFNTVITRAKSRVVAIGKPKEVIEFENKTPKDGQYKMNFKCWHEYLKLCIQNSTLRHCDSIEELEELMKPTTKSTVVTDVPTSVPTSLPVTTTIKSTLSINVSSNDHPLAPVVPKKIELPISQSARVPVAYSLSSSDDLAFEKAIPQGRSESSKKFLVQARPLSNMNEDQETPWPSLELETQPRIATLQSASGVSHNLSFHDVSSDDILARLPHYDSGSNHTHTSLSETLVTVPPKFVCQMDTSSQEEAAFNNSDSNQTHTSHPLPSTRNSDFNDEGYHPSDSEQTYTSWGQIVPTVRYVSDQSWTLVEEQSGSCSPVERIKAPQFYPQKVDVADEQKKAVERMKPWNEGEMPSQVLKDIITDTLDEKKNVFDKITLLQEGLEHLKKDLTNEIICNLDDKLQQKCEELVKENEELRKSLRQAAQKTIVDLSNSTIVATLEVSIRSNDAQYVNWKEYGMAIDIPQNVFSAINEVEFITVEALAGGKFEFPVGMNLVSAVYAISVTKPLDEAIRLEIEHCVHLTDEDELKYLKFAVAPHSSGPPYKFEYVNEGKFAVGSRYGTINRDKFSLFCIGLEGENPDDDSSSSSSDEEEQTAPQENSDDEHIEEEGQEHDGSENTDDKEDTSKVANGSSTNASSEPKETSQTNTTKALVSRKNSPDLVIATSKPKKSRNSMFQKISYNGQMFYRNHEEIVVFAVSKQLAVLFKYLESNDKHIGDEKVQFFFTDNDPSESYIELIFDNKKQKKLITGWDIQPRSSPCKLYRQNIDDFGALDKPAERLIEVHPNTDNSAIVSRLSYCVPLKGVTPADTKIYIIRYLDKKVVQTSSAKAPDLPNSKKEKPLEKEVATDVFRILFSDILDLVSVGNNRLLLAAKLYSAKLISDTTYDTATDSSSRDDFTKSMTLMNAVKATIKEKPDSLRKLISVFERIEEFQPMAEKLKDSLYK